MTRVLIGPQAWATMAWHADRCGANETGGLLLGYRRSDLDTVVVTAATGPGKDFRTTPRYVRLDTADLQQVVERAWERSGGDVAYLGDWHLHHEDVPSLSVRDRGTLAKLAVLRRAQVPRPVVVIVGERPDRNLRAWVGGRASPAEVDRIHTT